MAKKESLRMWMVLSASWMRRLWARSRTTMKARIKNSRMPTPTAAYSGRLRSPISTDSTGTVRITVQPLLISL